MAEKKGLIYKLTMGNDNNPDYSVDKLPSTRWALFWDLVKLRFWTLVKINLLMMLFFSFAAAWLIWSNITGILREQLLPYTANLGFGYPAVSDLPLLEKLNTFQMTFSTFLIFVPLLMIASLGFAGGFHTIKMLVWGEGVAVASTFFKGIKNNLAPFLMGTLVIGIGIFVSALNFALNSLYIENGFLQALTTVTSTIILVLLAIMAMYIYTQAVTYKIKLTGLFRNSFIFAIGMLIQNLIFLALTAFPFFMIIILPPNIGLIFVMYIIFVGLSITVLIWTLFAHFVYDKFLNDKIEGAIKDRGVYRKSKEDIERKRAAAIERKKIEAKRYSNPKKKKSTKSIDEGASFEPLPTTFSRRDIQKLSEEKQKMKEEMDEDEQVNDAQTASTKEESKKQDDIDIKTANDNGKDNDKKSE